MFAGTAKVDITPNYSVRMDGMIREHASTGVHDRLYARALILSNSADLSNAYAVISLDLCSLSIDTSNQIRRAASIQSGIPFDNIAIACTHTHSGPSAYGDFNEPEHAYIETLKNWVTDVTTQAAARIESALLGIELGRQGTISHYRRLLADDGHIVMNWIDYPQEKLLGPIGVVDADLGIIVVTRAKDPGKKMAVLFNHAGHPNVMSGDNYLLSSDYVGKACAILEEELGCNALFFNGAQGTMDIDGLNDRDWEGVDRLGGLLAKSVLETVKTITPSDELSVRGATISWDIPYRIISDKDWSWAQKILAETGGEITPIPDGVGEDFLAVMTEDLKKKEGKSVTLSQTCFALNDHAFITIPCELFTEIGMRIKAESPFPRTYILGLTNGCIGYIPTKVAIYQGGYEVDTRNYTDDAEELMVNHSLHLLNEVYNMK